MPVIKPCAYEMWQEGLVRFVTGLGEGSGRELIAAWKIVCDCSYRKPLAIRVYCKKATSIKNFDMHSHTCKLIRYLFELYCSVCQYVRKLLRKKLKRKRLYLNLCRQTTWGYKAAFIMYPTGGGRGF